MLMCRFRTVLCRVYVNVHVVHVNVHVYAYVYMCAYMYVCVDICLRMDNMSVANSSPLPFTTRSTNCCMSYNRRGTLTQSKRP